MADTTKTSSPLLIAIAWAAVVVPTAWGLNYTVKNALKIFSHPTAAVSTPGTAK
jgi:hypothetical protein